MLNYTCHPENLTFLNCQNFFGYEKISAKNPRICNGIYFVLPLLKLIFKPN